MGLNVLRNNIVRSALVLSALVGVGCGSPEVRESARIEGQRAALKRRIINSLEELFIAYDLVNSKASEIHKEKNGKEKVDLCSSAEGAKPVSLREQMLGIISPVKDELGRCVKPEQKFECIAGAVMKTGNGAKYAETVESMTGTVLNTIECLNRTSVGRR